MRVLPTLCALSALACTAQCGGPLNMLGGMAAEHGEDFAGDGTGHDGWTSEANFGGATGKKPVEKTHAAEAIGVPLPDQVAADGAGIGINGRSETGDMHAKLRALAARLAPAEHSVVDRELGELHHLLGNYKHVHESVAALHTKIRATMEYKPDGMPHGARVPEDRVLRELRRTAEVVRKETARPDRTVGVPTVSTGHHPEPETLDPEAMMRKRAYENLPIANGQKDVRSAPQLQEETAPAETLAPTPTPAHEKSIYELVSTGQTAIRDADHTDDDAALPAGDGILGFKQ